MTDDVLVIRTCKADMTSYGGFRWPTVGLVEAPDWDNQPVCGGGLHGLRGGEGDWSQLDWSLDAKALLVRVAESDLVTIGQKVKFPRGEVVEVGPLPRLLCTVLCDGERIRADVSSQLAASGNSSGLAASGDDSQLAASGNSSRLAASGYASQLAASGNASVVVAAGLNSKAKAGPGGVIALAYHDGSRVRLAVGYVGEGLDSGVWYCVRGGNLVPVEE